MRFLRRSWLVAAAVSVAISLGLVTSAPASSLVRNAQGRSLSISQFQKLKGHLSGVDCFSGERCLAVGALAVRNPKHSLMALLLTTDGGTTWVEEGPQRGGELDGVTCVSTSDCWSVGSTGGFTIPQILRSTNGGVSWSTQAIAQRGEALTVSCGSISMCVVGGSFTNPTSDRVLAPLVTHDGGLKWAPSKLASWMAGVSGDSCPSASTCEVVGSWVSSMGSSEVVGRSINGGRSWSPQKPSVHAYNTSLESVDCTSASICEAVGAEAGCPQFPKLCGNENVTAGGLALRTTDRGAKWIQEHIPKIVRILQSVWCASPKVCLAVGLRSNGTAVALHTSDAGSTWLIGSLPPGVGFLDSVSCRSTDDCVAVGFDGGSWPEGTLAIVRTGDGGVKWTI